MHPAPHPFLYDPFLNGWQKQKSKDKKYFCDTWRWHEIYISGSIGTVLLERSHVYLFCFCLGVCFFWLILTAGYLFPLILERGREWGEGKRRERNIEWETHINWLPPAGTCNPRPFGQCFNHWALQQGLFVFYRCFHGLRSWKDYWALTETFADPWPEPPADHADQLDLNFPLH